MRWSHRDQAHGRGLASNRASLVRGRRDARDGDPNGWRMECHDVPGHNPLLHCGARRILGGRLEHRASTDHRAADPHASKARQGPTHRDRRDVISTGGD